VIVAIYTDGYENASTRYTMEKINRMITHQRETYKWEFLFLAANQDAITTASQMGIDRHMSSSVEFCVTGMVGSTASLSRKISAMRSLDRTEEQEADYKKSMTEIVKEEAEKQ
jgi:hypothetical protein